MANLVVPNESKTVVEQLLLGDVTIQLYDCDGNVVEGHGLLANDLLVKSLQGDLIPLPEYVMQYAGAAPNVTTATITTTSGNTVTLQEIADSVEQVDFSIQDLYNKYNSL